MIRGMTAVNSWIRTFQMEINYSIRRFTIQKGGRGNMVQWILLDFFFVFLFLNFNLPFSLGMAQKCQNLNFFKNFSFFCSHWMAPPVPMDSLLPPKWMHATVHHAPATPVVVVVAAHRHFCRRCRCCCCCPSSGMPCATYNPPAPPNTLAAVVAVVHVALGHATQRIGTSDCRDLSERFMDAIMKEWEGEFVVFLDTNLDWILKKIFFL